MEFKKNDPTFYYTEIFIPAQLFQQNNIHWNKYSQNCKAVTCIKSTPYSCPVIENFI